MAANDIQNTQAPSPADAALNQVDRFVPGEVVRGARIVQAREVGPADFVWHATP